MLITEVFAQFLAEQQATLTPKTSRDYASVVELFAHQLDDYAWNNIPAGAQASQAAKQQGATFIALYDHTHLERNVSEFLNYFVPRKVMAGPEFILQTCPRVMRKLLRWMRERQLVALTHEEIKALCENQLWADTVRDMGF